MSESFTFVLSMKLIIAVFNERNFNLEIILTVFFFGFLSVWFSNRKHAFKIDKKDGKRKRSDHSLALLENF